MLRRTLRLQRRSTGVTALIVTTLALSPPNVAEANYNVASAYHSLGQQPQAKRAVLRALEAAPRFEKAQELLLRIVGQ